MEVVRAEPLDTDISFKHWNNDLHKSEVVIWSDHHDVLAVLEDRRADGTVVFTVENTRRLEGISDGGRLAFVFRADHARVKKGQVVPLFATAYAVDRHQGIVEAHFTADHEADRHFPLREPVVASLNSDILFRRPGSVRIVCLSPYGGEFVADDPGRCLSPGMIVRINAWLPWSGELRLQAQLTAYREDVGAGRFAFRMVDRRSVENAATLLVGTVDDFHFEDLKTAGVRLARMTRFLTVKAVSDQSTFEQALELRLAGNRDFGRLTDVSDIMAVSDYLDPHSINFICLLGDKPVGTGRVVVNDGNRALSEIETETPGLPDWTWSGGFVEVSRVAIHPDYRSGGVLIALFREIARLAFKLDCRYLMLDAIEKLVPIYERVGAKRLPIVKMHPYSRETVYVMVIDISEQLSRIDKRAVHWQYVFGPVLNHHLSTSSPRSVARFVRGSVNIPYWLKRTLSRAL